MKNSVIMGLLFLPFLFVALAFLILCLAFRVFVKFTNEYITGVDNDM
jgi:sensor histidine kinase YesM